MGRSGSFGKGWSMLFRVFAVCLPVVVLFDLSLHSMQKKLEQDADMVEDFVDFVNECKAFNGSFFNDKTKEGKGHAQAFQKHFETCRIKHESRFTFVCCLCCCFCRKSQDNDSIAVNEKTLQKLQAFKENNPDFVIPKKYTTARYALNVCSAVYSLLAVSDDD